MLPVIQVAENQLPTTVNEPVQIDENCDSNGDVVQQSDNIKNLIVNNKHRRTQTVTTLQMRYEVIMWMREQEAAGVQNIPMKAIQEFPPAFLGVHTANRVKARRWWHQRNSPDLLKYTKIAVVGGRPRTKAMPGRGRKPPAWVTALYSDVMNILNDVDKKGGKYSVKEVRAMAHRIVESNPDKYDVKVIGSKIDSRTIRKFFKMREEARKNEERHRDVEESQKDDLTEVPEEVRKSEEMDSNFDSQPCVEIDVNAEEAAFVEDGVLEQKQVSIDLS